MTEERNVPMAFIDDELATVNAEKADLDAKERELEAAKLSNHERRLLLNRLASKSETRDPGF